VQNSTARCRHSAHTDPQSSLVSPGRARQPADASGQRIGSAFHCHARPRHRVAGLSMNMTRMTAIAIGLTVVSAGALGAQTQETKTTTKTKVEMKGGKDVAIVGCLERRDNGDYML